MKKQSIGRWYITLVNHRIIHGASYGLVNVKGKQRRRKLRTRITLKHYQYKQ